MPFAYIHAKCVNSPMDILPPSGLCFLILSSRPWVNSDFTVQSQHTSLAQDNAFRKMQTLCRPDKVLVLHLRGGGGGGASNKHSSDILLSALHLVRKACLRNQPMHLHCFTGFQHDVEEWLQEFPSCYFLGLLGKFQASAVNNSLVYKVCRRKDCSSKRFSLHASPSQLEDQNPRSFWRCCTAGSQSAGSSR